MHAGVTSQWQHVSSFFSVHPFLLASQLLWTSPPHPHQQRDAGAFSSLPLLTQLEGVASAASCFDSEPTISAWSVGMWSWWC